MLSQQEVDDKVKLLNEPLHGIYIPVGLFVTGCFIVGCLSDITFAYYGLAFLAVVLSVRVTMALLKRSPAMHDVKWQDFELAETTIISKNSAIYRFKLSREDQYLDIPVGHHLACCMVLDGKDEIRYYTPISSPMDRGYFDILVKSYTDGKVSKKFAHLREGETVKFRGPVGRLDYVPNMATEIGMIAGGSGITPILSVLSTIVTTPDDVTNVNLLYANETENDILLREELDEFAEKYPGFKVNYTLTTPPANWDGETGYITKEMIRKYMPKPSAENKLLICGPPAMKTVAIQLTTSLGWKKAVMPSKSDDQVFIF
ncbi:hypothetical protein BABINDRAFT_164028 [Babjeviella inositovora NRRL Y-12698]|uniref:NADH-cytochrome b5 reductase n=1 Tax=Babjeviella inositovora NRRL Y-12698 TaxID=984486 RepID=A0A1E3QYQ2_9ASCO|nr:uncharacterized protein BABINDRAFT_164028 [Babjeviella inositovora NRRL Y-12698]ODQ82212.1 hypothetical protein BABINDRAFT_164028 [Babjeviella inositovora NRRL Y-12698]